MQTETVVYFNGGVTGVTIPLNAVYVAGATGPYVEFFDADRQFIAAFRPHRFYYRKPVKVAREDMSQYRWDLYLLAEWPTYQRSKYA